MDTTKTTTTPPTQQDEFLKTLQDRLISQSGMVSSSDTNIEKAISDTIASTKQAGEATRLGTESAYNRQIEQAKQTGAQGATAFLESGRGQAINQAAYSQMQKDMDTNLKDLEQRKQEVLLQGDSATASKIADLQMQSLTFKNQAMQQSFTNLLNTAGFALQSSTAQKQQALAEKAQTFQEKQAKATVALQYGIKLNGGETLDEVVSQASIGASAEQKARLAQMTASINASNAQTAKLNAETGNLNAQAKTFAGMSDEDIATATYKFPTIMDALIKTDPQRAASVSKVAFQQEQESAKFAARQAALSGIDSATALDQFVSSNTNVAVQTKTTFATEYEKAIKEMPAKTKEGVIPQIPGAVGGGTTAIIDWLFGSGSTQKIGENVVPQKPWQERIPTIK